MDESHTTNPHNYNNANEIFLTYGEKELAFGLL